MTDLQTWLVCVIFYVLACSNNRCMYFGCEQLQRIRVLTQICRKLIWRLWLLIQKRKHPVLQVQWKCLYSWRKITVTSRHQLPCWLLCKTVLVSINVFYILWVNTVTYAPAPFPMKLKRFVVSFEVLSNVISVLRMFILWFCIMKSCRMVCGYYWGTTCTFYSSEMLFVFTYKIRYNHMPEDHSLTQCNADTLQQNFPFV
jgi:hypothetical protein